MLEDPNTCIDFWLTAKQKVQQFAALDDGELVFGANTFGTGHHYNILPTVADAEILGFEQKNALTLPLEYRTFLQHFGAGGAGPYYGIYSFHRHVQPHLFTKPFPHTATVDYEDESLSDDDPVWNDFDGLAFICEAGCGTDFYLELNGANPGQLWCSWVEECRLEKESFLGFYRNWLEKVDVSLQRYQRLKQAMTPQKTMKHPTLTRLIEQMDCPYREQLPDANNKMPVDEIWLFFEHTPAKVVLNKQQEVLKIEIRKYCVVG